MSKEDLKGGAGEDQDKSRGASDKSGDDSSHEDGADDSKGMVSRADHERAMKDLHKFKTQAAEEATKRADLEKQFKDLKSTVLKDKQDFKGLFESEQARSKELETKLTGALDSKSQLEKDVHTTARFNAVHRAATALGLRKEAAEDLELVGMDGVGVERTDTGRILVSGAKEFAETLKKTKPHWFEAPKAPGFNPGGGGTPPGSGTFGVNEFLKLEKDWKAGKITREVYDQGFERYNQNRLKRA